MKGLLISLQLFVVFSHSQASDKIIYVQTQSGCTEVSSKPTRDCRWHADLDYFTDQEITGCKIIAYKIQWFSGSWSNWFVTGINDIDGKINLYQRQCNNGIIQAKSMRRWWSYFYDHNHRYIKCCARKPLFVIGDATATADEQSEMNNKNLIMNLIESLQESEDIKHEI